MALSVPDWNCQPLLLFCALISAGMTGRRPRRAVSGYALPLASLSMVITLWSVLMVLSVSANSPVIRVVLGYRIIVTIPPVVNHATLVATLNPAVGAILRLPCHL